jgi:hypothetical protein
MGEEGEEMPDVIYVLLALTCFALVLGVVKGVGRL